MKEITELKVIKTDKTILIYKTFLYTRYHLRSMKNEIKLIGYM